MQIWELLCEFPSRSHRKTRRNLSTATGVRFRSGLSAGRLRLSACSGYGPGDFRQNHAGLLAGGAVDVIVAEENLGRGLVGSAVLGHIVRADVDGGGVEILDHLDGRGLGMGTRHAVGLTFSCLNHEVDTAVVSESLVQLEGEGLTLADDGRAGGILHTEQRGRRGDGLAAAGDDTVVQAGEEVRTADLALSAEDGTCSLPRVTKPWYADTNRL